MEKWEVEVVVEAEAKEIRAKNTWAKRWAAILKKLRHSDLSMALKRKDKQC